jgi:dTDP-4-dehydrorhamnose 3,5-epimerase-like enzyme
MPKIINLAKHIDLRGNLVTIDNILPYNIARVYYIYNVNDSIRGGHRHKNTIQALICIKGNCKVYCNNNISETIFELNEPDICLLLDPEDWHEMYDFSNDSILLVLASLPYNIKDYIYEPYQNSLRRPKKSQ